MTGVCAEWRAQKNRRQRVDIASPRYVPDGVIDIFIAGFMYAPIGFSDEFTYALIEFLDEFVWEMKESERVRFSAPPDFALEVY
ncbi:MAG: hypothetical protein LBQ21_01145 [Clostridiales Family XIII bacterium]|jgi:hypothetical protein|nr:hypothetical protein [Clostridiales Family XIII bacterium]